MSFKLYVRVTGKGQESGYKWDLSLQISPNGELTHEMKPVGSTGRYSGQDLTVPHRYLPVVGSWKTGFFQKAACGIDYILVEEATPPESVTQLNNSRQFLSFGVLLQIVDASLSWAKLVCHGNLTGGVNPGIIYHEGDVDHITLSPPMFDSLMNFLSKIDTEVVEREKLAA